MTKPITNTTVIKEDFFVEVDPSLPFYRGSTMNTEKEMERACNEIKTQIDRHVDGISSCIVQWKTRTICDFCKCDFEADKDGPVCCDEAFEKWEGNQKEKVEEQE